MVVPAACRAPRCAAASIPRAAPLTTHAPTPPRPAAMRMATSLPDGEQLRAPTIATRSGEIGERATGHEDRHGRVMQELEELRQVLVVDRRHESCPVLSGFAFDHGGVENPRPLLIRLAAGRPRSDRCQAPLCSTLRPRELVQLVRLDAAKRRQHQQGGACPRAFGVPVGEPRRHVERPPGHIGASPPARISQHGRGPPGRHRHGRRAPRRCAPSARCRRRRDRRSCARP